MPVLGALTVMVHKTCVAQDIKNVELWDGDDEEPRHVIINTEWGAFGANGELDFIRTKWDMAGMHRRRVSPGGRTKILYWLQIFCFTLLHVFAKFYQGNA